MCRSALRCTHHLSLSSSLFLSPSRPLSLSLHLPPLSLFPSVSVVLSLSLIFKTHNDSNATWRTQFSDAVIREAITAVAKRFNFVDAKPEQAETLTQLFRTGAVCLQAPTNFGKSFVYQAYPLLLDLLMGKLDGGVQRTVFVTSPIKLIVDDALLAINKLGLQQVVGVTGDKQLTAHDRLRILRGEISIVICTIEQFGQFHTLLRALDEKHQLCMVVHDEVHAVNDWQDIKMAAYTVAKRWVSHYSMRVSHCVMSATLAPSIRTKVMSAVGLSRCVFVRQSNARPDITYELHPVARSHLAHMSVDPYLPSRGIATQPPF